jgi:hypothetical protein
MDETIVTTEEEVVVAAPVESTEVEETPAEEAPAGTTEEVAA